MSCLFGVSPRPGSASPFSVSAVALLILFLSLCRSATLLAMRTPLALYQGPLPIRSRALIVGWPADPFSLRYACHVLPPAPAAVASIWQCRSAPSRPPRLPPLPGPALVTKKLTELAGCACWADAIPGTTIRTIATHHVRAGVIAILLSRNGQGSVT